MSQPPKHCYEFGPFRLDAEERLLARDGAVIPLTPKAFDLLLVLIAQPGHLLAKEELMQALWPDAIVEETNLAWNISHVRKALGEGENGERYIETVPRRGYRFVGEVREIGHTNGQPSERRKPPPPTTSDSSVVLATAPVAWPERTVATFRFPRERWLWLTISLLLALAALLFYLRRPSPESSVTRFAIPLPPGTVTHAAFAPVLALAPDGRQLVISALIGAKRQLWLRPLDSLVTQPLAGTEGATFPFWSPDSRHLAFFADSKLKKLDVASGVIETICPAGTGLGGDWNQQGVILFCNGEGAALSRVNVEGGAVGGQPEALTVLAQGETNHNFPAFLPDGKHYLFQAHGGAKPGIYVGSLDSPDRKLLLPLSADSANSTRAVWASPGYLLYALNRNMLLARAFDADRLELRGEAVRVADNVIVGGPGTGVFTASANGTLAFIQYADTDTVQLTWRDHAGNRLGVIGPAARWTQFRLSPDERFAALQRGEQSRLSTLWLLDLAQGTTTRFVTEGHNLFPVWSPDSQQLAFGSARNMPPNVFVKSLTGKAPEERLLESRFQCDPSSWTPDGKAVIFTMIDPQTRRDLWLMPVSGDRKPQPLLQTKANEQGGKVSPDGKWLAYNSDESGSNEIYVTQFPQPARAWRISTHGGANPFWRGDGKELFFLSGNKLMAVSVSGGAEFQFGTPQPLFDLEGIWYEPSQDGQRFLTFAVTERAPAPPIHVVLNWAAEMKK
jgi:DNA-binding winged helix-turn-helix (wHTH) protein/Tol biopolymer transport system component